MGSDDGAGRHELHFGNFLDQGIVPKLAHRSALIPQPGAVVRNPAALARKVLPFVGQVVALVGSRIDARKL